MKLVALVTLAFLLAPLALAPVQATINTIQPGDFMASSVGGCTLNYVFDGTGPIAGRVFIGTAAHCVASVGESIDSSPFADFGTVAAIGSAGSARTDWAIIEVKPEFERWIKAYVKGHPDMPTGVATHGEASMGDLIQISGYGMVFNTAAPTQERRVGVLTEWLNDQHYMAGPIVFGDSGGPLTLIESGKALGLNSRLCVVGACTEFGPTIEGMMAQAAAQGFTLSLRTV